MAATLLERIRVRGPWGLFTEKKQSRQGHSRSLEMVPFDINFLLAFHSNYVHVISET